ncbi:putative ABC transporter ATP-binding protein YxlF [compost metagenome]
MLTVKSLEQRIGSLLLEVNDLHLQGGVNLLIGENGAGKTTLLRLLATVDSPKQGEISYGGRNVHSDLPLIRSQIGYVPSEIQMYEEMTALGWLMYFAEMKGIINKKWIDTLLTRFHLQQYRKVKIRQMSDGVRRRLLIAQAFLASPQFIFLDEPLNGMDLNERKWVISLLNQLNPNVVVFAAVHELNEWESVAKNIIWLDEGKIGFVGRAFKWVNEAPVKVYEGVVTMREWELMSPSQLIFFRQEYDGMFVRVISEHKSHDNLQEVPPTIEDVYFMKKAQKAELERI